MCAPVSFSVTALFFIRPILVGEKVKTDRLTNETFIIRPFPLSAWFPYDEQNYYLLSYCWQFLDGCIAASFVTYTDCLIFSLIIFPLGQITLLNHALINSKEYIHKLMIRSNTSSEEASRVVLKSCVLKHHEIIW